MSSSDTAPERGVPAVVAGTDVRSLPIGPEEAFLLSRIDGNTSESELVTATGLEDAQVRASLQRLQKLGAIHFSPKTPPPEAPRTEAATHREAPSEPRLPSSRYDPAELDEPVELEVERRRTILDAFYGLPTNTHYTLLGVSAHADRRAIKAGYFNAVKLFHPDRYFGKQLGSFKAKLERVFAAVTAAHDALTHAEARQEYDDYLASQGKTRELERFIADSQRPEALEETLRTLEHQARVDERRDSQRASVEPVPYETDPEARRRAVSRKLRMPSGRHPVQRQSGPTLSDEERREQATRGFRDRYEARVDHARTHQLEQYLKLADAAAASNKAVSAATALRMALHLAGDDPALRARLEAMEKLAQAEMSETYLAQGAYEERTGRFAEAARSYEKAARGKPSAKVFDKVATCALRAGNELHTAVEFARQAVRAEPDVMHYRQTLIQAYLAAGLKNSALAEIERATAVAPGDPEIKDWLRRAKHDEL